MTRDYLNNPEYGNFDDEAGVCSVFEIDSLRGARMLFGNYTSGPYEGESHAWLDLHGQLMFNYASHCSCYGLGGQWEPEPFIPEQLVRMNSSKYELDRVPQEFLEYVLANYDKYGLRTNYQYKDYKEAPIE